MRPQRCFCETTFLTSPEQRVYARCRGTATARSTAIVEVAGRGVVHGLRNPGRGDVKGPAVRWGIPDVPPMGPLPVSAVRRGANRKRSRPARSPARSVHHEQATPSRSPSPGVTESYSSDDPPCGATAKRLDTDALDQAGSVRARVGGTRPTAECPEATPSVACATASNPGRAGRSSGVAALSASAAATTVTRAPSSRHHFLTQEVTHTACPSNSHKQGPFGPSCRCTRRQELSGDFQVLTSHQRRVCRFRMCCHTEAG